MELQSGEWHAVRDRSHDLPLAAVLSHHHGPFGPCQAPRDAERSYDGARRKALPQRCRAPEHTLVGVVSSELDGW